MTIVVGTVSAASTGCRKTRIPARMPTIPMTSDQIQGTELSTKMRTRAMIPVNSQ
jgi:hypothetical protein